MTYLIEDGSLATADVHFGDPVHAERYGYNDTHEYARVMVDHLNSQLSADVPLFLIGDMVCDAEFVDYVLQLKCSKLYYILGNRESKCPKIVRTLVERGIDVASSLRFGRILLTHIPPHSSETDKFTKVFHGHLHYDHIAHHKYYNCSHPVKRGRVVNIADVMSQ